MAGGGISGGWEPQKREDGGGGIAIHLRKREEGLVGRGLGAVDSFRPSDEVSGSAVGGDGGGSGGSTMGIERSRQRGEREKM